MHLRSNNYYPVLQTLALTCFVVIIIFVWQGNKGFSLWDEGFLWYGVLRVMQGEIPIRDFMAYDPGRYYWSATLMGLWGDNGIMALRVSVAIFQAAGLFAGLILIADTLKKQSFFFLLLSVITLVVWMLPRHKLFDISISILLVGVFAFLIKKPTNWRYFFAGLCLGLIAVFGRNHGFYGLVAGIGVILWLGMNRKDGPALPRAFTSWLIGMASGFMPVILMILLVPGFSSAFWESIRFLYEVKSTNLPLPVPWPWQVDINTVTSGEAIRRIIVGLFFTGMLLYGIFSLVWACWRQFNKKNSSPVFVATAFLALPYAHFAFSRADVNHLAQGIFPSLLGVLVILGMQSDRIKWPLGLILCTASLWVTYPLHPGWQCLYGMQCEPIEISGNDLLVDQGTARDIKLLRKLAANYAPDGENIFVTPFWPGAYALLDRKSPVWEIYALFPRSRNFEQAEIERLKVAKPRFALVLDRALDKREELRFRNTHPMINQYIQDHFERLTDSPSTEYQIYRAKETM